MTDKDVIEILLKDKKIKKKKIAKEFGFQYTWFTNKFKLNRELSFTMEQLYKILNYLGYNLMIVPKGTETKNSYVLNFKKDQQEGELL